MEDYRESSCVSVPAASANRVTSGIGSKLRRRTKPN